MYTDFIIHTDIRTNIDLLHYSNVNNTKNDEFHSIKI